MEFKGKIFLLKGLFNLATLTPIKGAQSNLLFGGDCVSAPNHEHRVRMKKDSAIARLWCNTRLHGDKGKSYLVKVSLAMISCMTGATI